jgi:glycosyltransferase involved in cell wall biosynthesis
MRIAMFHWGFPPIIGGVETHLAMLMPYLVKRGHQVYLLTGSVEGSRVRYTYKGAHIYRTPAMDLNWLSKRGFEDFADELRSVFHNFLETARPDIIHAHNMHYFSKLHAGILQELAQKKKVPVVLTAHNAWDDSLFLELSLGVKWTHVIAVSHFIKSELVGIGVHPDKITVIHHGIDLSRYRPGGAESVHKTYPQLKGRRIIFHPARMGLAKGCDTSVKSLRMIKKKLPEAFLVMAGTRNIIDWDNIQQKDIAYIVHLIHKFKLEKDVLIDVFSLNQMIQLYRIARVCVYPSAFGEPFGLTMLESMASGVPIIVTDSGGMPEIIKDGINGFVVRIKDYQGLARRTSELLTNETLRRKMGRIGIKMVKDKFTLARMA